MLQRKGGATGGQGCFFAPFKTCQTNFACGRASRRCLALIHLNGGVVVAIYLTKSEHSCGSIYSQGRVCLAPFRADYHADYRAGRTVRLPERPARSCSWLCWCIVWIGAWSCSRFPRMCKKAGRELSVEAPRKAQGSVFLLFVSLFGR